MNTNSPSPANAPGHAWKYPRGRNRSGKRASQKKGNRLIQFQMAIGSPEPGEILAQRFEIQEQIAVGGMSLIYRAFDQTRQQQVALKFLSPTLLQTPNAIEAFKREAQVSMRLSHPNILRVFDVQRYHDSTFLVMELLEGGNLRQWLSGQENQRAPELLEEKCRILISLCRGLQSAHQITAHCDLKPENIGITAEGEVKIMDFGLARLTHQFESKLSRDTVTQLNGGTPYYIAPEQLSAQSFGTPLSDQFSFGVIAYELITGELPIGFSQPLADRELLPSRRFNQAIDQCLATRPGDRFPDIGSLLTELEVGLKSRPGPWAKVRSTWRRRSNAFKTATTIALTGLVLSFPFEFWRRHMTGKQAKVEAAWRRLDQSQQNAANLAESGRQRRRTLTILQDEFTRRSTFTNRTTHENIELTTLSNDLQKAKLVWKWLQPQLSSEGNFVTLEESLNDMRRALRNNRLSEFQDRQSQFDATNRNLVNAFETIPKVLSLQLEWERLHSELGHYNMMDLLPKQWQSEETRARTDVTNRAWTSAATHWEKLITATRKNLGDCNLEAEQRFLTENERWQNLFGKLGPPDLRFLKDPHAQAAEAIGRARSGHLARAIDRFNSAADILKAWSDEVTRHERALDAAEVPGVTYLRAHGMRFAQVFNRHEYWGVTEVRVMDFARWVVEEPGVSPITATNWIDPGFIQGPTDPAVWITRETASQFSAWVSDKMVKDLTARGYPWESPPARMPLLEHLEKYNLECGDKPVRLAIFPAMEQWETNHFREVYEDRRIDPNRYLGPADRGKPSPHGIFGLHNGIWEWTNTYLDFSNRHKIDGRPIKWLLTGGGDFGVANYNGNDPPRTDNYYHVLRKDAIGLRLNFVAGPTFDPKSFQ